MTSRPVVRLAAAGLADDREASRPADVEVDAVDGLDRADLALEQPPRDREVLYQALDLEQRLRRSGRAASGAALSVLRIVVTAASG